MDAIGDNYAILGYSSPNGQARQLQLQPIVDFDQLLTQEGKYAIGNLHPQELTPTGAALRFMTDRIEQTKQKTKIVLLITDGEPQHAYWSQHNDPEFVYNREYAFQDTKKSIIETKRKGINLFCISIDTNAKTRSRLDELYGKQTHVHIDNVNDLPQRLVNFYKRIAF